MKKGLWRKLPTSSRMILSTLALVAVAFLVMILIVSDILYTDSIERSKITGAENADRLASTLNDRFDSIARLLSLAQQSFEELDFYDGMAHESVGNILTTLLELNPNAHSAWFVAEPGIHHADRYCITEYKWSDGTIVDNSNSLIGERLKTPEKSAWYHVPLATGRAHLETFGIYANGHGYAFKATISVPVFGGDEIIGVCGIDVFYEDMFDMPSFHTERNGVVLLTTQNLAVLHAHDRELVGMNLNDFPLDDMQGLREATMRGEPYSKEVFSPLLNEDIFLHLQPIFFSVDPEHAPLYLHIGTPLSELYADAHGIVVVLATTSTLCMLLILLIIFFSVRRIILPIRALTRQAQQITEGSLWLEGFGSQDSDPDDKNEVAVLRHAFIKVLHALRENLSTVERRVRERTQELTKLNNYINILMDSTSNISMLLDRDLNVLYFGKNALPLLGEGDASNIIGQSLWSLFERFSDRAYVSRGKARLHRILSEKGQFVEDDAVTWPDGTTRMYRIYYNQVSDDNNNFEGLVIVMRDLTDIRQEEAQRRQDDLLNATKVPCMVWDEKGDTIAINEEFIRVFGLPADISAEDDETIFSIIHPETQPDGRRTEDVRSAVIRDALNNGFAQENVRLLRSDGTPLYFMVNAARFTWLTDHRMVVYCFDRTDLMHREEEAREAEESIKIMLDSTPMICFLRDEDGNIIDCNQEALNMFGVAGKSELRRDAGHYYPEFQPDGSNSVEKSKERIKTLLDDGVMDSFEWMFKTAAGELLPVETTLVRINWKDTYRFLSYSRDLRKEKADEQIMLEGLERERALMIQKEAAQAANETKNQFIANMSHEIRTPMNAVLGMAELLLQESLNDRQHGYATDIKTSAEALLDIINDILDVSKIQAGKLSLVPVHYNLGTMIDNACSVARILVEDRDITFKLDIEGEIPGYLYGDDIRLRQVLLNLLSNAVKFTGAGHVRLAVRASGDSVRFTVSDTGIGIRAENIDKLFDAFEQFDARKNRDKCGTGLGLSITKALVGMMGGRISVESEYGQGTSFHVDIPKVLGDESLIHKPDGNEIAINAPDARILIVDDNRVNLNVARGLLRLCQIKAETAASGFQAIESVRRNRYDIIFMDHLMPEMDGLETTSIIRELGVDTPIIALTASAVTGTRELMMAAGMDDYLSKPIMISQLKQALSKWLPADKLLGPSSVAYVADVGVGVDRAEFWEKVGQIGGLSVSQGLERVDGQRDSYEQTLKLMIKEIEKCVRNLKEFLAADDMRNFRIEVHGIKSSLVNIGATELGNDARELEVASGRNDAAFCAENLSPLLQGLDSLRQQLEEAFSSTSRRCDDEIELPPELPPIFERLTDAFRDMDIVAIDEGVGKLTALSLTGALGDGIEQITDAVFLSDFEGAIEVIQKLTSVSCY